MLKNTFTIILMIFFSNIYGQIIFEKGYYIDENGKMNIGYIKNEEWVYPPKFIVFKKNLETTEVTLSSQKLKEFSVDNQLKYKWFKIKIYNKKLTEADKRKPSFREEYALLNKLVEGESNLYEDKLEKLFLVEKNNGEYFQLDNFNVILPDNTIVLYSTFKEDLSSFLKFNNEFLNKINNSSYDKNKLINLIVDFNTYNKSESNLFILNKKKVEIYMIPKIGISYNKLNLKNESIGFNETLSGLGFIIGSEFEFSLPSNKRKWSVILDPNYYSFSASIDSANYNSDGIESSESGFQLGLGLRHYLFLEKNQLFVTLKYNYRFSFSKEVDYSQFQDATDFTSKGTVNLGFGIRVNKKIYSELNFSLLGKESPNSNNINVDYSPFTTSITLGYRIF